MSKSTASAGAHVLGAKATTPAGAAWDAVKAGDHRSLMDLIGKHGQKVTEAVQGTSGYSVTALTEAAARGDTWSTELLLKAGAEADLRTNGHHMVTPLVWAIRGRSIGCVRLLLDAGATSPGDDLADEIVAYERHEDYLMLKMALKRGNAASQEALCRAVEEQKENMARLLLEAGADPNGRTADWDSPIELAIANAGDDDNESARMLELLIENKARVNITEPWDGKERPPLVQAVERGRTDMLQILIRNGADAEQARRFVKEHGVETRGQSHRRTDAYVETLRELFRT